MTEFVRALRTKLDELGAQRGRHLYLGARVPRGPADALRIGLDVAAWNDQGLIDMVNVAFNSVCSPEGDVEGFRAATSDASLYGELNYTTQSGVGPGGYTGNIRRRPPDEVYKSTALSLLERGVDGVSLFNFGYWRDHSFHEPRRKFYPGIEPPFRLIAALVSREKLRESSQLATLTMNSGSLPVTVEGKKRAILRVHLGDCFHRPFCAAVLRLEAADYITHLPIDAAVNGTPVPSLLYPGELFPAYSLEGLPEREKVIHFTVDPALLRAGYNEITVSNHWRTSGGGHLRGAVVFQRLELALYRRPEDFLKFLVPPTAGPEN